VGKTELTSRERYLITFENQEPDRVPLTFNVPDNCFFNEKIKWHTQLEKAKLLIDLGLDPTIDIWLPDSVCHPDVTIKTWRSFDKTLGCPIIYKEYHTPKGILRQVVKETEDWCSSRHNQWIPTTLGGHDRKTYGMELFDDWNVSRRLEPWVKGPEDLEKLKYIINVPDGWILDEWKHDAIRAKEFAEKHGLLTMARRTIVGDAFQWFCDIPNFLMTMIDDPDFIEEFFDIFHRWAIRQAEIALDIGVDVFMRRGWYEIPEYFGGGNFEKYLKDSIQEESRLVHQAGSKHCYLLTEGMSRYIDILEDMDVDILFGVEPVMGRADLAEMKKRLGSKKTIWGGVSGEITLNSGTENEIREETRKAIKILAPGGGFVLSPMAGLFYFAGTPWGNVDAMIDEWRKVGKYPITI